MHAAMLQVEISHLGPSLQNILRQSYDFFTIMPMLRSTYDSDCPVCLASFWTSKAVCLLSHNPVQGVQVLNLGGTMYPPPVPIVPTPLPITTRFLTAHQHSRQWRAQNCRGGGYGESTTGECNGHRPADDGPGITASPPSDTAGQLVDVAGWMGT